MLGHYLSHILTLVVMTRNTLAQGEKGAPGSLIKTIKVCKKKGFCKKRNSFFLYNNFTFYLYVHLGYVFEKFFLGTVHKSQESHFYCRRNWGIGSLIALNMFNMSLLCALNSIP